MSHSRRTPCCESEAIRYLQEETVLTTGKEGAWFTVDSLAAAMFDHIATVKPSAALGGVHRCCSQCAAAIIQAALRLHAKEAESS